MRERGFTIIEGLLLSLIMATIFALVYGVGVCLLYKFAWKTNLEPFVHRDSYVLSAQSKADKLGSPERTGFSDGKWDDSDRAELCKAIGIPQNTPIENIPSWELKKFVTEN